ncbi:alpha/beta hydrolase [Saccharothrix algeriensis]|uniref:Alpha/beta fold hydrolase n=1 Tax=Saccharothrix algeriensis TaxID=173560 RepID=A0A8T8I1V3_9PSEU|nr:alpha/beta hydrolase [Saccharothrix algeriensis]MBM7810584.1 pimeloyl-ACP methyl ester carboxylesterase [Saccharothrix algeriensis]QTR04679.1 alpha/beta fold hydrolase [Saccharothrix algeriensis]
MPRRRRAALLLVALSALTACSAGPSNRPVIAVHGEGDQTRAATPTGPREVPPLESYRSTLAWSPCTEQTRARMGSSAPAGGGEYECARLTVTLDAPSRPGRGNLGMALLRVGTGASALVVVGDPDGEPGTLKAARLAAALPPAVLSTFTLIGVDRRGTGRSDGVQCVPEGARVDVVESDPASPSHDELLEAIGRASQECVLDLENRLPAVDSWRTAADLERLRDALGTPHLNAIGIGDGSRVLTLYASRYPDRVGRMVFDGAPDPTVDVPGVAEARAVAAEATFTEFGEDCAIRSCPLGADAAKRFTALLSALRTKPLRGAELDLTPGTATTAVLVGLADRARWPALAEAIAAAEGGDAAPLTGFALPLVLDDEDGLALFDPGFVIGCNDTTTRIPPESVAGLVESWRDKYPLFGAWHARRLLLCGPFPVPQPEPVPALTSAPPVLVVTTANDPVTPQGGSERAAQALPAGVVVGWQGSGHGALGRSSCAAQAVEEFLVNGRAPAGGTVCPP